ncbi:3,4-dihydroxy-2-butanone-4-phosphate synthase, partial [Klebsiella pneumoniae]|uniref:3,4-dihydroxy-2-butanone-4-phosphate synthase n=1 Tax=Klebsiella pneumoniae TaxID=573 RepID=UPI00190F52FA
GNTGGRACFTSRVGDEDRENDSDLVVPAQMATPKKIDFIASHDRGPIGYRRRRDHLVERRAEARFTGRSGGEWTAI